MVYSYLMYLCYKKKSTARLFSSDGPILSFIIETPSYITAIDFMSIEAGIGYQVHHLILPIVFDGVPKDQ
jgi:hypothetical protein